MSAHALANSLELPQGAHAVFAVRRSLISETEVLGRVFEQSRPWRLLKAADTLGDAGLGHMQPFGRTSKTPNRNHL
jgi:hypothetical protein